MHIEDGAIPDGSPSTVFAVQEILDSDETFSIVTTSESNMNNIWTAHLFIFLILIFFSGCATPSPPSPPLTSQFTWFCEPPKYEIENKHFEVTVNPICSYWGCPGFTFYLRSKTDKQLKIDWNKTQFLKNGKRAGGFMFEGVVFKDVYGQKPPDIFTATVDLSIVIYPNDLVFYDEFWKHRPMQPGENGVDLFVRAGGKDYHEQLSIKLQRLHQTGSESYQA
jgi:hypothetical protein